MIADDRGSQKVLRSSAIIWKPALKGFLDPRGVAIKNMESISQSTNDFDFFIKLQAKAFFCYF